jgi:hypothetical protein
MKHSEYNKLKFQLAVLKEVAVEYGNRSIDNVINNIEARIKYAEESK